MQEVWGAPECSDWPQPVQGENLLPLLRVPDQGAVVGGEEEIRLPVYSIYVIC